MSQPKSENTPTTKKSPSWKIWATFVVILVSFTTLFVYRSDIKTAVDKINVAYNNSHPNFYLKNPVQLEEVDPVIEYFMGDEELEFFDEFEKRADKSLKKSSSSSSSDSSTSSANTSTPIYDQSGIRFLFALGGIVVLNMFAIVIHHIFHKLSSNERNYRSMEKVISPF